MRCLIVLSIIPIAALAAPPRCEVVSAARLTPVIELYTSEGCSSCPPADEWLSTLKGQQVVAQAFHVAYWDYIGWTDRFASAAFTARQRQLASEHGLNGIYTPQVVRNGHDWHKWSSAGRSIESNSVARASIRLVRDDGSGIFVAQVTPQKEVAAWTAYWTVTEHGHSSRVRAGENSGEFLKHDFVVRQYTPVGRYQGPQTLSFLAIAAQAQHPRQINLVVSDPKTGEPLQAVSLQCGGPT